MKHCAQCGSIPLSNHCVLCGDRYLISDKDLTFGSVGKCANC